MDSRTELRELEAFSVGHPHEATWNDTTFVFDGVWFDKTQFSELVHNAKQLDKEVALVLKIIDRKS